MDYQVFIDNGGKQHEVDFTERYFYFEARLNTQKRACLDLQIRNLLQQQIFIEVKLIFSAHQQEATERICEPQERVYLSQIPLATTILASIYPLHKGIAMRALKGFTLYL
jgi:hypothetical protein